jgi:hypothetical protein
MSQTLGKNKWIQKDFKDLKFLMGQLDLLNLKLKEQVVVEERIALQQIERTLDRSIQLVFNGVGQNSTNIGQPKMVHWFEWNKTKLHLYDIVSQQHTYINLVISF